jgi:hypothetical protein
MFEADDAVRDDVDLVGPEVEELLELRPRVLGSGDDPRRPAGNRGDEDPHGVGPDAEVGAGHGAVVEVVDRHDTSEVTPQRPEPSWGVDHLAPAVLSQEGQACLLAEDPLGAVASPHRNHDLLDAQILPGCLDVHEGGEAHRRCGPLERREQRPHRHLHAPGLARYQEQAVDPDVLHDSG